MHCPCMKHNKTQIYNPAEWNVSGRDTTSPLLSFVPTEVEPDKNPSEPDFKPTQGEHLILERLPTEFSF